MHEENRVLSKIETLVDKLPYKTAEIRIEMADKTCLCDFFHSKMHHYHPAKNGASLSEKTVNGTAIENELLISNTSLRPKVIQPVCSMELV